MTDENESDSEEVRVDAGGGVEEEQVQSQQPSLNKEQAREEITRLIEVAAQSGLSPEEVEKVLEERAEATEYLYEGMQRYGQRADDAK